jgi:hypothetical protein
MIHLPPNLGLLQPHRVLLTVSGTITEIDPNHRSHMGATHQIFSIQVRQIVQDSDHSGVAIGDVINIAVRFGDRQSLAAPISGLQVGAAIMLSGAYITASAAYGETDGEHNAVIHYTHHPIGWVEYHGHRYS